MFCGMYWLRHVCDREMLASESSACFIKPYLFAIVNAIIYYLNYFCFELTDDLDVAIDISIKQFWLLMHS